MDFFKPGDTVRKFAAMYNLEISEISILVEGENDQRYLQLASRLFFESTGKVLLSRKLSAFPTGIGDAGGVYGIQNLFHPLRCVMDRDLDQNGRKIFHAVALFDDDRVGRKGFSYISNQNAVYRKWRDIFLLKRYLPRMTRDPVQTTKHVDAANVDWDHIGCEIEDLLSLSLIEGFSEEISNALMKPTVSSENGTKVYIQPDKKGALVRFAEVNAIYSDMTCVIEYLRGLRYCLGLSEDGDEPNGTYAKRGG